MFVHPEETSSDVQYWRNVFSVAVNGPVLIVNWFAISLISGEEGQLAIVIAVTVIVYIGVGIYYGFVDKYLPETRSLTYQIPANIQRYRRELSGARKNHGVAR